MHCDRRAFFKVAGGSLASLAEPAAEAAPLEAGGWRATLSKTGEITSLRQGTVELVNRKLGDNHPRITVGGGPAVACNRPKTSYRKGPALVFEYQAGPLTVRYQVSLAAVDGGAALEQRIAISASGKVADDVTVELPRNIHLPFEARQVFAPLRNGVGRRKEVSSGDYVYDLAGACRAQKPELLAIPMVDEFSGRTDLRIAFASDPWFTSCFRLPAPGKPGGFHCTYLGKIGVRASEERVVVTGLHRGGFDDAMKVFYQTCLTEVREGPEWVHDVAMIDYDYMSQRGKGWFSDIDKLAQVVKMEDRPKVLLALHGWYDYVGRYCFDYRSRSLDKTWLALPNARAPKVQALAKTPDPGLKWGVGWHRRMLDNLYPVEMSWTEMHRRIRYARDKGFRVALYYADGISAADGLAGIYEPSKVLRWGGWFGPDTNGKAYAQNPLHPEVYGFYTAYIEALLAEVGKEVDGFVWDETFYVFAGDLGTQAVSGYADRAMMHLVRDVAATVAAASPKLAFFTSDNLRPFVKDRQIPTALAAHGTYQDSACQPEYWPYGLFPNYRNNLWSCNWFPVSGFALTKYAVDIFDTPVTISNGYGDNLSLSEMRPATLKSILDLFAERKERQMRITWVEEKNGVLTYRGKPLQGKKDLMGT